MADRNIKYHEIETFSNNTKFSFVTSELMPSGDYEHNVYYHDGVKEHTLASFYKSTDRVSASLDYSQKATISSIRSVLRAVAHMEKTVNDNLNNKNKTLFMLRKLALSKCKDNLAKEVEVSAGKLHDSNVAKGFAENVTSKLNEEFGESFVKNSVKMQSKKVEPVVEVKVNGLRESPLDNKGPICPV